MTTITPRINITTRPDVRAELEKIAMRDNVTLSAKAAELIEIGLSLEEDSALSEIAHERMETSRNKYIKHQEIWK